MIIIPDKRVWTHTIFCPIAAQESLFVSIVFKILKTDLFPLIDGVRDRVHNIVDLMVVRLDPVRCVKVSTDLLRLRLAHHTGQLLNQDCALLPVDESRRRDRVDQEFDLRDLKLSVREEKRILCASDRNDIETFSDKNVYIVLYGFSGGVGVLRLKDLNKLGCRNRMVFIRILI